ncbi:MAG TPA: 2-amino-4-hydroxy-6-hydroxymethyldihydropteridine diphosphokinase, partial [Blastocatellia bacterium]|nr:2-amino-4-hydroxy-6-hydroxymethyldihydropteridine diphosphokinase [Blastocatellia bacterium]
IENFPALESDAADRGKAPGARFGGSGRLAELVLPHPRLHRRRFVLEPLCEIEPGLVHPVFGVSCREMLSRLPATGPEVWRWTSGA